MKKLFKVLGVIVVILLVAFGLINYFLGPIVQKSVTTVGPRILGTTVTLRDSDFRLLRGYVSLKDLVVGSPEGFKADRLFALGEVTVELEPASVFSDTIHIKRVYIKDPGITYEQSLHGSNIGKLMETLGGDQPEAETDKTEAPSKEGGKKVVIDEVLVEGASVKVALAALGGKGMVIPLPPIRLSDIGKENEGATMTEALTAILQAVLGSVTSALGTVGDLGVEGVKAAADLVGTAGGAAIDGASAVGSAAVDGASAVGGAAVDGAAAVGGAVADGAGAVVDGVSDTGKKIISGVGGLFGGEKESKKGE